MNESKALRFLLLLVILGFGRGYSQNKLTDVNGTLAWLRDTTKITIEDLFGRFRETSAVTLDFSHSAQKSKSYGVTSSSEYNSTTLSFETGNRGTYGLSASASNTSSNRTYQSYDVGMNYRPLQALQASGEFIVQQYSNEPGTHWFYGHAGLGFVRDGGVAYDPARFGYYYYFSEMLPGKGWTVASSIPSYSSSRQANGTGYYLVNDFSIPVSAMYGWSDRTTIGLTGTWESNKGEGEQSGAFGGSQTQARSWGGNEQSSLEAKISSLLSEHFLLSGSIEWTRYYWNWNVTYRGGWYTIPDQFNSTQKDYGVVSTALTSLWLQRSATVTDLRRSPYNGTYLGSKEAKNQFQVAYFSHDNQGGELASAGDNLGYGIGEHLEFEAGGSSTWQRKDFYAPMNGWDYSFGLTLHNLNFGGAELSDLEYYWGKITQPGDYIATVSWEAGQAMGGSTPRARTFSASVRFAFIGMSDVQISYSHSYEDGNEESSYNNLVCNARWDAARVFRMSLSGGWSHQSITPAYSGPDYSSVEYHGLWIEITLQALL